MNEECKELPWCGKLISISAIHYDFQKKYKEYKKRGMILPPVTLLKNKNEINGIRESGKINIAVLDYLSQCVRKGISTAELDRLAHKKTIELGALPAPLGYNGFPNSICTSVNEQVCHAIPSDNIILKDGDIVNIDVSTIYNGFFSDSSRMFCIGETEKLKNTLVETAKKCVLKGLERVMPWKHLGDMGYEVFAYASNNGFSVVREFGGHGVGIKFHEDPFVSFVTKPNTGMLMVPGMIFTIEPMINMGGDKIFIDESNNWIVYTLDRKPSAQWEVTVLITDTGYEILAY